MTEVLKGRPVNVQVKHRAGYVSPRYDLYRPDVGASLAGALAETYGLKSTGIIVNQTAPSTQYFSFRYFLPGEPFRYFDSAIGIDQTEIVFANPATIAELLSEVSRLWKMVFEGLRPTLGDNYLEATLHCETESSTKAFLNGFVNVAPKGTDDLKKGFSLTTKAGNGIARIALETSDSIADGLYVMFALVSKESIQETAGLENLFKTSLNAYRTLQSLAQIELMEPT